MFQELTLFGQTIKLYGFFNNMSYFAQFLVVLYVRNQFAEIATLPKLAKVYFNKRKNVSLIWRWGFEFLLAFFLIAFLTSISNILYEPITQLFLGNKDANFMPNIFIVPIIVVLLGIILLLSPLKLLDLAAPVISVALIFYKIACFCDGCCYGVEWHGGMYNYKNERYEFPVQLVEIACAVVMFIILMLLIRKKNLRHGILYPLFMLMYCGSRFVSEFWRDDYPAIWGILKSYHIQCMIGFAEGLIFLIIVLIWGKRITDHFDAKNEAFLEKHRQKVSAEREKNRHKRKVIK